ncbi:MAG: hypothetical protein JSS49_20935 [Planctomycetes bacterium]|nr:hypothetical protein [Planctomycetota bacterium]
MLLQQNDSGPAAGRDVAHPGRGHVQTDPVVARRSLFAECRGQSGLQLVLEVTGEAHARKISLDQPFLILGAGSWCDVQIDHPDVQPCHVCVQWIDGRLFGCSLDSAKPVTHWIGRKPVKFGPFRLSVPDIDTVEGIADPQSRNPGLADEVPQVQLKFDGVEQQDNLWPVDRNLTLIGRGSHCKLRLDHPEIPCVLASLIRTESGCWLINLCRHDSLRVNEQKLLLESLDLGDVVQLGAFRAEVSAAPFESKSTLAPPVEKTGNTIQELATEHRQRLGELNQSLDTVQVYLDSEHLNAVPDLKIALQKYILHAQRHHREMQAALERLSAR